MNTFLTISAFAHTRWIRSLTLGVALVAAGLAAPAASLADWNTLDPDQTPNERAIALIEGMDPANFLVVAREAPDDVVITRRPGSWDG